MRLQNFEREGRQTRSVLWVMCSLVPRPVRAIRVTRGGLEPSAIARGVLGEFSRQAWQVTSAVTSHPKSPRTTGNEAGWCANIMVNSHTSQYSLVLGLSLANHKISNGSQRNYIPHPSIYKVSDVYLDITTIIKLKVRDPCKRVRMTEDILLIYVRLPCLQGCSLRLGFKRRATAVPNSIQKLWIHTSY